MRLGKGVPSFSRPKKKENDMSDRLPEQARIIVRRPEPDWIGIALQVIQIALAILALGLGR